MTGAWTMTLAAIVGDLRIRGPVVGNVQRWHVLWPATRRKVPRPKRTPQRKNRQFLGCSRFVPSHARGIL